MKSELSVQKNLNVVNLDGVEINKNSLIISDDATDATLKKLGTFISTVDASAQWWIGDYCVAKQKRTGKTGAHSLDLAGIAAALGFDETRVGYIKRAAAVARFFAPEDRVFDLGWSSYEEAYCCGDLEKAKEILRQAEARGWSKVETRKQVRLLKASAPEMAGAEVGEDGSVVREETQIKDPGPVRLGLSELYAADAWAREKIDEGFEVDEKARETLLNRTKNLREFLKTLEDGKPIDV